MDTYEKKYKEALELARVAAFNGHQSLMEGIFPELAESEDEKTRKRIIALVNAHGQGMYKSDMLAWLENIPYTIDHEKREGFHLGYKAGLGSLIGVKRMKKNINMFGNLLITYSITVVIRKIMSTAKGAMIGSNPLNKE